MPRQGNIVARVVSLGVAEASCLEKCNLVTRKATEREKKVCTFGFCEGKEPDQVKKRFYCLGRPKEVKSQHKLSPRVLSKMGTLKFKGMKKLRDLYGLPQREKIFKAPKILKNGSWKNTNSGN